MNTVIKIKPHFLHIRLNFYILNVNKNANNKKLKLKDITIGLGLQKPHPDCCSCP